MDIQNLGGGVGWMVESENEISEQQEKIDRVLYITERALKTLEKVVSIYAKFGDREAFDVFQNRVNDVMKKASCENYFNDANYENTDQE